MPFQGWTPSVIGRWLQEVRPVARGMLLSVIRAPRLASGVWADTAYL